MLNIRALLPFSSRFITFFFVHVKKMFSTKYSPKSTLICGDKESLKCFMLEGAMHWADKEKKVFFISQAPLKSFPATYHDKAPPSLSSFQRIKFFYLPTYEKLVEQLVVLQTFVSLPEIIFIENLDHYFEDTEIKLQDDEAKLFHIARLCAFIQDSMNACCTARNCQIHLCASLATTDFEKIPYHLYFDHIWHMENKKKDEELHIQIKQIHLSDANEPERVFLEYSKFQDGTWIFKEIFKNSS